MIGLAIIHLIIGVLLLGLLFRVNKVLRLIHSRDDEGYLPPDWYVDKDRV